MPLSCGVRSLDSGASVCMKIRSMLLSWRVATVEDGTVVVTEARLCWGANSVMDTYLDSMFLAVTHVGLTYVFRTCHDGCGCNTVASILATCNVPR